MIRWPSETRQSTASRSVSSGACRTRARFATTRSIVRAELSAARPGLPAASIALQEARDLVEDRRGDLLLGGARHAAVAVGLDQRHLVVGGVEADPRLRDVVVDDEVG